MKYDKIFIICQVRQSSKRFPNKWKAEINGISCIDHIRKLANDLPFPIIYAIPKGDIELENYLFPSRLYSGSIDDVLDRFYQAAKLYNAKIIIRIGADTPFLTPGMIYHELGLYLITKEPRLTKYLDIFSFEDLEEMNKKAHYPEQREHVTPWLVKSIEYSEDIKKWSIGQSIQNKILQ